MDKINILYTSCFVDLAGGGQRSLLLLLKYSDKQRFTPVLAAGAEGELSAAAREYGIATTAIDFPALRSFNLIKIFRAFISLRKIIKDRDIRIIHVESPREFFYAVFIRMILRVKIVFHARVADGLGLLDRFIYNIADQIIAVSQSVLSARFSFNADVNKAVVVYNAVDLKKVKLIIKPLDLSGLKIGYFGRIEPRKGLDILIKAVNLLTIPAKLFIYGKGKDGYLEKLNKSAVGGKIYFCGYLADIFPALGAVDVVVLPSVGREGLSRIIIEAMAAGKIVLASDNQSNKEALGPEFTEFIFPAGDPRALAQALERIFKANDLNPGLSRDLRKRAEKLFDAAVNTRQIEAIYEKLI